MPTPNDPIQALLSQGRSLHQKGQFHEAEAIYRRVLASYPNHPEGLHLLGVLAHQAGNNDAARDLISRSIAIDPRVPDAHHNLAEVYLASRLPVEAEQAARKAIAISPRTDAHYSALGRALRDQGRFDEAIAAHRKASVLSPQTADHYVNLGNVLGDARHFDEALSCYGRALTLEPGNPRFHSCMATTLAEMGRIDDSIATFDKALEKSDFPDAHWNRGLILLLRGDFQRGWDDIEFRWQCSGFPSARLITSKPQWDGTDAPGKSILLFGEQGAGDTIQFVRYAPLVKPRCARVMLVCAPELKSLLTGAPGVDQVLGFDEPPEEFDFHVPLLTLPRLFKTDLSNIPAPSSYLHADPARIERWRDRLSHLSGRKVGLAWAGRPTHLNDRNRSIRLIELAPLASLSGIEWVSLQVGPSAAEAKTPPGAMPLFDASNDLRDYADTAALIANLDLVISVDTSVAHLAAALGKPVWVLLPYVPDWRWLLNRHDSPWYPSVRLFRQDAIGDWTSVLQRIAKELSQA